VLPAFQYLAHCSTWWLAGAVQAWQRGTRTQALAAFERCDRYHRALVAGSHSLIATMVSLQIARRGLQTISAVGLRDREMARALLPLLTVAWPDTVAAARRWMVVEAAFQRAVAHDTAAQLAAGSHAQDLAQSLGGLLMRHRVGWHPERTIMQIDARWLRWIDQLDGGVPSAIRAQRDEQTQNEARHFPTWLAWRNTLDVAVMGLSEPLIAPYLARQADLDLQRELAALALAAQAAEVPAAQREAWSRERHLSPETAQRETDAAAAQNPQRTLRLAWPAP
jgi:hypothetical protein